MSGNLTPAQFVAKWSPVELSERAASQEHFLDLCRLLGQPTPAEHDATGAEYTFEKCVVPLSGASRGSAGERGFVDVWWRRKFAWEYKRKGKYRDLAEAYRQLCQYREAIENPPLLIVSDITRTEIHTNFTGTAKQVHVVELSTLAEPGQLDLLRRVFTDPGSFKPEVTPEGVTRTVAVEFGKLAQSLRSFGHAPHDAAHFLMKCMFCLFAEDVGLLPTDLFTRLLRGFRRDPADLRDRMTELFRTMGTGGAFGAESVSWFNGGLFDEAPALKLTAADIEVMLATARADWSAVEPAIFGTLFERSLDPDTRAQIGAHYTSREDIMLVVEPVILDLLRREWDEVKAAIEKQLERRRKGKGDTKRKADKAIEKALHDFVQRLASVRILDPACGSGNFLYVAIQQLLYLEKEVITFAARPEIALGLFPQVRPTQLFGIEINPYAAELAQVVIWIGYLQWMRDNGFAAPRDPILEPLQTIECRDAILAWQDEKGNPMPTWREGAVCSGPATWPQADFIIGNPPFLGAKMLREALGDNYVENMYEAFDDRIPRISDLCCYWFELASDKLSSETNVSCGLLATQAIRNGAARRVLEHIIQRGHVFLAWSDREWILDGAILHISIVGFASNDRGESYLNGELVNAISADLSPGYDLTSANRLETNHSIAFLGIQFSGPFDMEGDDARSMIRLPSNPSGRKNYEVVRPVYTGSDLTRRPRDVWVVDFGIDTSLEDASKFEAPLRFVEQHVKPMRLKSRSQLRDSRWWLPLWTRSGLRLALTNQIRFICTPTLAKHRVFVWVPVAIVPNHQVVAFARSDDYFFGVLHSSIHELWARRMGTQLREAESGFRYTPTTCFETFPLPWPPGKEPTDHPAYVRISEAAKQLNEQRERWLNPPEWIEPIAAAIDAKDDFADVPEAARALIRQSAIMAAAAKDKNLKKRTLTNLYNERPTWLRLAHEQLDRAVLAAYAATDPEGDWSEDWAAVWVDSGAGQPLPPGGDKSLPAGADAAPHPLAERREEIDQRVLANLLRMNLERADRK